MNIIILRSSHRYVSAIHVYVFIAVRAGIFIILLDNSTVRSRIDLVNL